MKLYTELQERELEEAGTIYIRIRPKRLLTILLVVLLHALLLFALLVIRSDIKNGKPLAGPMIFVMDKLKEIKRGEPEAKKTKVKVATSKPTRVVTQAPNPNAITDPNPEPPPPVKPVETVPDMASMINAARERRQQSESAAAAENRAAEQGNRGLSAQEIAEANVKHSMQRANGGGTNGVFQIVSKSVRMGTFTFRGWKVNANSWKQTIEVDAGLGGNIDLAMVRKMIEIIRTHYKGDFRWESQRLGRVVTLSARLEDQTELENFMLEEFPEFSKNRR